MRILLIENDSAIAESVEAWLKSEGMNVYTTDLGEEGIDLAKIYDYDCILLELKLPDIHGLEVLKTLRRAKCLTPIIIQTGIAEIDMKVKTFGAGADDYITKPFHKDELVARIHAVVRRSRGHAQSTIQIGNIVVNLDAKTVTVKGLHLHLTPKEYQALELLALRRESVLSKEAFLNHLYGGMDEPQLKIIDVFICKLRKKLATANDGVQHVHTTWGVGYVLRDEPQIARKNARWSHPDTEAPVITPEPVVAEPPEAAGIKPEPALIPAPSKKPTTMEDVVRDALFARLEKKPASFVELVKVGQKAYVFADEKMVRAQLSVLMKKRSVNVSDTSPIVYSIEQEAVQKAA